MKIKIFKSNDINIIEKRMNNYAGKCAVANMSFFPVFNSTEFIGVIYYEEGHGESMESFSG